MLPTLFLVAGLLVVALLVSLLDRSGTHLSLGDRLRLALIGLRHSQVGAVTLAQAKLNTQDDLDAMVIDEFRKSSTLLDSLIWHQAVSPMGGGSTLTYGYHRVLAQRAAAFRAINAEYTPAEATKVRRTTDLKPLGGSFQIDRVLADIARSAEVTFQMEQLTKATSTKFADEVINGDVAVDANGFDGLDTALTGTTTELGTGAVTDWRTLDTQEKRLTALDALTQLFAVMDGAPTLVLGNSLAIAKLLSVARGVNMNTVAPLSGLTDQTGAPISRAAFGDVTLTDPGDKAGSTNPIIPIETRTVASVSTAGLTDIYAVRIGMDGFHGVAVAGQPLVRTWLPDFSTAGAVKTGEVEMGPVSVALKATKAAAVLRNVRVS